MLNTSRRTIGRGVVSLVMLAGCGGSNGSVRQSATTGTPAVSSTVTTSSDPSTTAAACSNLSVLQTWSLHQRVTRLIVAPSLDFNIAQLRDIVDRGVGGVLFLGSAPPPSDLASRVVTAKTRPAGGAPIITMADEEGGGIQRLQGLVAPFPWPRDMASSSSTAQVRAIGRQVGTELRGAGIDMDLAPVLDADGRPGPSNDNPDGSRSFSADPATAGAYGVAFMSGLQAGGELSAVKHFPGIGESTGNTDVGPGTTRPWPDLENGGLAPFAAAAKAGADAVLVANDTIPGLTTIPASLSPGVISGVLRDKLGFEGAVLTDSLSAGALAAAGYTVATAAVAAVGAGADLVLFGSTLDPEQVALLTPAREATTVDTITASLSAAVEDGTLPLTRVDDAVMHVLALGRVSLC